MATLVEKLIVGATAATVVILPFSSAIGAAVGGLGGEIMDHVPYVRHAVPEGMAYVAAFINPDAAEKAKNALMGNLDKVGAALGFIAPYIRSSTTVHKD